MADELAETIRVVLEYELDPDSGSTEDDAKAIAAAIRSSFWLTPRSYSGLTLVCKDCGVTLSKNGITWDVNHSPETCRKPDPTPADERKEPLSKE